LTATGFGGGDVRGSMNYDPALARRAVEAPGDPMQPQPDGVVAPSGRGADEAIRLLGEVETEGAGCAVHDVGEAGGNAPHPLLGATPMGDGEGSFDDGEGVHVEDVAPRLITLQAVVDEVEVRIPHLLG